MSGARSALIVATYAYDDQRLRMLRAPERDADALAEVLGDPEIGGFEVSTVVNQPAHVISVQVAEFFAHRHTDDVLLLHFSCHGVKDDSGELFLAAKDTRMDLLEATAVSSAYVNRAMTRSRSGCVVLLLDCCYAGAFARGMTRAGGDVDVTDRFGGRGRAVITASTALQFAFEGAEVSGGDPASAGPSVFTRALVDGLRTGEADRNSDGIVSLDELYAHVHDEVTRATPDQTPQKWLFDVAGDLHVARRATPVTRPSELPDELVESMESLLAWERESTVGPLQTLLLGSHPGRALAARIALEQMAGTDDSARVRDAARRALDVAPDVPTAPVPVAPVPPVEQEQRPSRPSPTGGGPAIQVTGPAAPGGSTARSRSRWRDRRVLGAAAVLVVVGLVGGWLALRHQPSQAGAATTSVDLPPIVPGRTILLAVNGQPAVYDVAKRALTWRGDAEVTAPGVSPNGLHFTYLAPSGSNPHRGVPRVIDADGTHDRDLLSGPAAETCPLTGRPTWSINGSLAFQCYDSEGTHVGLRAIASYTAGSQLERGPRDACVCGLTWAGPGQIVYGATDPNGPGSILKIWDLSTHASQVLATNDVWAGSPDWTSSPNGPRVLFVGSSAAKNGGAGNLCVLPLPATSTPACSSFGDVLDPTWSPDGTRIAYVNAVTHRLWITDSSGSPGRPTTVTAVTGPPTWAP